MTAAHTGLGEDGGSIPERGWTREDFECLTEAEAADVLLRRLRTLLRNGVTDPLEALMLASKLELPLG
jgi:hypothetical protein